MSDDEQLRETIDEEEDDPFFNMTYEEKLNFTSPIAQPLASKKLAKKLMKLLKKAQAKKAVARGIKDVPKNLRKGKIAPGLIVIAGDIEPVDVAAHIPMVFEEKDVPYCYVPSKRDIGLALGTKRTVALAAVERKKDYADLFDYCLEKVKAMPLPIYWTLIFLKITFCSLWLKCWIKSRRVEFTFYKDIHYKQNYNSSNHL